MVGTGPQKLEVEDAAAYGKVGGREFQAEAAGRG